MLQPSRNSVAVKTALCAAAEEFLHHAIVLSPMLCLIWCLFGDIMIALEEAFKIHATCVILIRRHLVCNF